MYCGHCGAPVPEDAVLCPECGAPVEGAAGDVHEAEGEIHPILVAANLARRRGNFEEATAKCIEVLRRFPNNATAHSLIGDIYADQGLLRDAAEWYKLALELDRSSQVDRRKLETLVKRLAQPTEAQPAATSDEPAPAGSRVIPGAGLSRAVTLGMGVVVAVLVLVLAGAFFYRRAAYMELPRAQQLASRPSPAAPRVTHEPAPPGTATASPATGEALPDEPLLASVRAAARSSDTIDSVEYAGLDPRNGTLLVVFQIKRAATLVDTKQTMLRSALAIARAGAAAESPARLISLRGKVTIGADGQSQPELALAAEIDRASLASLSSPEPSPAEIAGLLRDTWWHPALRHIGF